MLIGYWLYCTLIAVVLVLAALLGVWLRDRIDQKIQSSLLGLLLNSLLLSGFFALIYGLTRLDENQTAQVYVITKTDGIIHYKSIGASVVEPDHVITPRPGKFAIVNDSPDDVCVHELSYPEYGQYELESQTPVPGHELTWVEGEELHYYPDEAPASSRSFINHDWTKYHLTSCGAR